MEINDKLFVGLLERITSMDEAFWRAEKNLNDDFWREYFGFKGYMQGVVEDILGKKQ